jgi:hypothetical protein
MMLLREALRGIGKEIAIGLKKAAAKIEKLEKLPESVRNTV